jgi:hypothetical protein
MVFWESSLLSNTPGRSRIVWSGVVEMSGLMHRTRYLISVVYSIVPQTPTVHI